MSKELLPHTLMSWATYSNCVLFFFCLFLFLFFFTLGHLPSPLGLFRLFTILCLLCTYYLLSNPTLFTLLRILHSEHYVPWLHHIVSPQLSLLELGFLQLPFLSSCFWCQCSDFSFIFILILKMWQVFKSHWKPLTTFQQSEAKLTIPFQRKT